MAEKALQDNYPDEHAHCFGCGRLNKEGLHIRSYWEGDESVCRYTPGSQYTGGVPGYAYGGLIASLIDCHGSATAAAAAFRAEGSPEGAPFPRFVSASLKIDFLKPTPMGKVLELRGMVKEAKGRKVIVSVTLAAGGEVRAKGESVLVRIA